MKKKLFNFGWGEITCLWNGDKKDEPSQIRCYDNIGKNPWTGDGMSDKDFANALDEVPTDRTVEIHINSRGGDVHQGLAMKATLLAWKTKNKQKVVTVIDGIAASTASWFSVSVSDEVKAHRSSQMFVHDALMFGMGNAEDFRDMADNLDKTSGQIAQMYADKSGKSKKAMRDLMKDETLLTGEEAEEHGLVDTIIDGKAVHNFTPRELNHMTNVLSTIYNSVAMRGGEKQNKQEQTMKKKLIQFLNAHGVKEWEGKPITEETSDEHLEAALNSIPKAKEPEKVVEKTPAEKLAEGNALTKEEVETFRNDLRLFNERQMEDKKARIKVKLLSFVNADKMDLVEAEDPETMKIALVNEKYLDIVDKRRARAPGPDALQPSGKIELVGNSIHEVQKFMLDNGPTFMNNFIGGRTNGLIGEGVTKEIGKRAMIVGNAWKKHRGMLLEMLNTNTIDAGLQRQIILQEMLEEFRVVLAPLQYFCTVFTNVPLEGTDEVDVPFYPLSANASTSFVAGTGYTTIGNTATNTRPVKVGGDGSTAATANTARDRKYRAVGFSSYELARQPYLNYVKLMVQEANALAVDVFKDIVQRVITAANFAGAVKTAAAVQFTGNDVADLWEQATGRNWPQNNRCLVLNHKYKTPLMKDPNFKYVNQAGTDETLRKAAIKSLYGFEDIPIVPNLDTYSPNGENLVGWINHMSALLVATAPIMPAPAVRALLIRYDVVAHPDIGLAFEYRRFGDAVKDQDNEVVEISYGANKGIASALGRITSA